MIAKLLPGDVSGRLVLLLLIVLAPLLLLQVWMLYSRFEAMRTEELKANLELARAVATTFDAYTDDILHQGLAIGLSFTQAGGLPEGEARRLLLGSVTQNPSLREITWLSPQGQVVNSSNPAVVGFDVSDRAYFQEIANGREWVVSDLLEARVGGEPVFAIGRGIRDGGGELRGIVLATVLPERLGAVLHVERAGQAAISVIDRQGQLVYRYPALELAFGERSAPGALPTVRVALGGKEATGYYVSPFGQERRMAGATPIGLIGWVALASRPEAEVIGAIVRDSLISAAGLLAVAVVGLLVALYLGRGITTPMRRLRQLVVSLASGGPGDRVVVDGPLEVQDVADASVWMAEQIQARERQLRESEERLRLVVNNSPDAIFYQDRDLRYIWVGALPAPLVQEDVLGKTDFDVFSADEAGRLTETKKKVVETGAAARVEISLTIGGQKRSFDAVFVPRPDVEDRNAGIFGYFRDITERTELDRLKDDFIAVAAHELKTPVAVMKGYAQALLRREVGITPPGKKMLEAIDRGSNRIDSVVRDLLDISKLQIGQLEFGRERIDLPGLVADVVDRKGATTTKHNIRLVKTEPAVVAGDRDRIEQVLMNLLDNAVKYTPKGGDVEVAVTVEGDEAMVSVHDYGIGIPQEKQRRIFQRFYSAHTGTPYDYGGLGIGLYISKEIAARHGGRMWLESEEGKGSTFYLSLPRAGAEAADAGSSATPSQ